MGSSSGSGKSGSSGDGYWSGYADGTTNASSPPSPVLGVILLRTGGGNPGATGFNDKANPAKYEAYSITSIASDKDPNKTYVGVVQNHFFGTTGFSVNTPVDQFFQTLQRQNGYVQVNQAGKNYSLMPYAPPAETPVPTTSPDLKK